MLVKEVAILEEAANDLEAGKIFYDQREFGVGDYFWDSLIAEIESLFIFAGIHAKEYNLHRLLAAKFPYAVYYMHRKNIVYVVAVLPLRRDPAWIEENITGRSQIQQDSGDK